MRRYETLETLFGKVDLSFAEKVLNEAYHPKDSAGRPPRKPLGARASTFVATTGTRENMASNRTGGNP